jgi:hypothetical protein
VNNNNGLRGLALGGFAYEAVALVRKILVKIRACEEISVNKVFYDG